MRNKYPKQKKYSKFRFLLDSAFAKPQIFKRLCKKASVKHIRHDFHLSPTTEDEKIYQLATSKELIVITLDFDFKKLIKRNGAGVFILNSGMSNEEIDRRIASFITGKDPNDYIGRIEKL